jgi:hypothetical protein
VRQAGKQRGADRHGRLVGGVEQLRVGLVVVRAARRAAGVVVAVRATAEVDVGGMVVLDLVLEDVVPDAVIHRDAAVAVVVVRR